MPAPATVPATRNASDLESRVLVLAPTDRDAGLTQSILAHAGVGAMACRTLAELCRELEIGAGAVMLPEEAIASDAIARLADCLAGQPPWSDLPVLLIACAGADSAAVGRAIELLRNVTVLERPVRLAALVSAVQTALRARQRQYQIRDHLSQRERDFQTRALLAAIVESSDDAILSKALDGRILTWNVGAEHLFGYPAAEAIGRSVMMLVPPDRAKEESDILERMRRGDPIQHVETVRLTRDGRLLDVSISVSPIRDSRGRVIAASNVVHDISRRKEIETALRDADRRKDEFLAILAHELRNPLAPIRNALHVLRLKEHRDPGTVVVGEMIERQVGHLVRLVDDLLEVSRITRGKLELRIERIDIAECVRGAIEASRPLIEAGRHRFSVTVEDEPLLMDGDPVRITQIVSNLLNNAAKYTDAGGDITVTVGRDADQAVVSVRDSGSGIPPEMLPKAFELFAQVDRRASRRQDGLGIGLTLVKSLVEMHGGTVRAFSEGLDRGSEFVVRLPLAPAVVSFTTAERRHDSVSALSQRRVMVVDDNRDAADSLGLLLKLLGADVQVTYNGADALKAIRTFQPSAVVLDIGMPEMDGHEVARRIRQENPGAKIMLIALSGWGQDEDRRRSRDAGFDHHLIKPADLATLETLLRAGVTPAARVKAAVS